MTSPTNSSDFPVPPSSSKGPSSLPEGICERHVDANGLTFRVLEAGSGDELALFLHGFPECAHSWLGQLPLLSELGFRAWAPDLRGYGDSERPAAREDYALEKLIDDVDGLMEAAGARGRTTLIAHDWGAIIAWAYAMRRPGALSRLVTMNVPHPACFGEQMSLRQMGRSWYGLAFQFPGLVERVLGGDGEWVRRMLKRTSSKTSSSQIDDAVVEACVRGASKPGAVTSMVNYYRALVRGGGGQRQKKLGYPKVDIPVLCIWGEQDIALTKEVSFGQARYAPRLVQRYLPEASHWVQHDEPELVNEMLRAWLAGEPVLHAEGATADIG